MIFMLSFVLSIDDLSIIVAISLRYSSMSVMNIFPLSNMLPKNLLFETSHDRSDSSKCTIRVLHLDCFQSNLLSWVIVSTRENGITDKHYLLKRNATSIPQLL